MSYPDICYSRQKLCASKVPAESFGGKIGTLFVAAYSKCLMFVSPPVSSQKKTFSEKITLFTPTMHSENKKRLCTNYGSSPCLFVAHEFRKFDSGSFGGNGPT